MRFLTLLLFPLAAWGQTIKLTVPPQMNGAQFKLVEFKGLYEPTVDSVLATDGHVSLKSSGKIGIASIVVSGSELAQLVVPKTGDLIGSVMFRSGSTGVGWRDSKENEALALLMAEGDSYAKTVTNISRLMGQISEFDPRRTTLSDSLESVYHSELESYNSRLMEIAEAHAGTYVAEVLVGLDMLPMRSERAEWLEKFDNDPAFMHHHYFHHVNFSDEQVIRNPFLKNKVLEYLFNYTGRDAEGINSAIDLMLGEADINQTVKAAVAEILIGFFREKDLVEYIEYINQQHLSSCTADLVPEIAKILAEVSPFKIGDEIPTFFMKARNGEEQDLAATTKKFKAIMFWASWCSHCQEEIPQMSNFLSENEDRLELAAFSLDSVESSWEVAANSFPASVQHFSDLKAWTSGVARKFGITASPTFILIDGKSRYLGRASTLEGLNRLLTRLD